VSYEIPELARISLQRKDFPVNNTDLEHLRTTITVAQAAREHGNHPFGAILVDENNQVLLQAENTVVTGSDCTGHAETNLMRLASQHFPPEKLSTCTLYTSTEPCAMCAGAIHWGNVRRVVFALSEIELYEVIGPSPEHLLLPCSEVFARSQRYVEVVGPASELNVESRAVHEGFWSR
jgi:tRNA(Arg) A34 adenosine deaminase TadA